MPSPFTRRSLLVLSAALVAAACASPTLPLPPPSRPNVAGPDANGTVTLSGRVPAKGAAFGMNVRTSVIGGQQTGSDGQFEFGLKAQVGDEIEFWYRKGTLDSQHIFFVVKAPVQPPGGTGGTSAGGAGGGGGQGGAP